VARYRLLLYDNRRLADEAFTDDSKDAGEMGDGQRVTALYELQPVGATSPQLDPLKYQAPSQGVAPAAASGELCTLKLRYKAPSERDSRRIEHAVRGDARPLAQTSSDTRFATAVAGFGMLLGGSRFLGDFSYDDAVKLADGALGADRDGYRNEFLSLVVRAKALARARDQ
jgi:Ca-activated chloride channel family protein